MCFSFLVSNLNLPPFSLKQLCCLLSYHSTPLYQVPILLSGRLSLGAGRLLYGLPRAFSSPGWRVLTLPAFLYVGELFYHSSHFYCPLLDLLQQVHILFTLGPTELVSVKSPLNPVTTSDHNYCCHGEAEHLGILLEHIYIYISTLFSGGWSLYKSSVGTPSNA